MSDALLPQLPPAVPLRAGDLTLLYEAGALRYVRLGDIEVLRMVYLAVRDENWLTVRGQITDERIETHPRGFRITYRCLYAQSDIRFEAEVTVTGTEDAQITFDFHGVARTAFWKNRIGLCVHHPTQPCAGHACQALHPDGVWESSRFPDLIAPHQPFRDVCALRWEPLHGCDTLLEFGGEVFETEDQRNWTDASFKTYSTPLHLPFPMEVLPGEQFAQSARLTVAVSGPALVSDMAPAETVMLEPAGGCAYPLPPIGLGRSSGPEASYNAAEIAAVRTLGLAHLRVEAPMTEPGWQNAFESGLREAAQFDLPLEVAAFFGDGPEREAAELAALLRVASAPAHSVLMLSRDAKTTLGPLAAALLPILRRQLPGVKLGIGTDAAFAEINRARLGLRNKDFLAYSVSPQVHAEDVRTLIENLAGQAETVRSARAKSGSRAVHVSPVTLKRRRNPDATGPMPPSLPGELPCDVDARQMSLLAAGWTIGSVKSLAEAGADSLTYYEVSGMRGLFLPAHTPAPDGFPATPGTFFPVYFALREILDCRPAVALPWHSSAPLRVEGLALHLDTPRESYSGKLLLANYTNEHQAAQVNGVTGPVRLRLLDETAARSLASRPDGFRGGEILAPERDGTYAVTLPPFAVAALDAGGFEEGNK